MSEPKIEITLDGLEAYLNTLPPDIRFPCQHGSKCFVAEYVIHLLRAQDAFENEAQVSVVSFRTQYYWFEGDKAQTKVIEHTDDVAQLITLIDGWADTLAQIGYVSKRNIADFISQVREEYHADQ